MENEIVRKPFADKNMAKAYCQTRIYLYPVIATEYYGSTLAETKACGTLANI
ncbi:MAG: hypothetical protein VX693_00905 [Pseudomonadota bacterium]|nr:hypothetical protein [Pseudomonadota bacterium]